MYLFVNMEDIHKMLLGIASTIISIFIVIIGFSGKRWLSDFDKKFDQMRSDQQSIISDLKKVIEDISDLKTEYQLVKSYIHEIEGRMEMRHQGHDSKIKEHTDEIKVIKHRLTAAEKRIEAFKLYHKKNHPTDEIE